MFLELIALLKEKLECGPCAEVIVQVDDPALLAANEGQEDPVKLKTFLKGKIKEFTIVADKFNCRYYQYTIEYDDEQLAEDVTGIDECQVVKICCADCLIDYVDEQFIDEATIASIIDNGDNTFTFDNGLGDTTTIDFAHTLSEPVDGTVRLTRPDGSFDEVDVSSTVNLPLLGSGTAADPLDVLISADADNILVLGTDSGLYVPEPPAVPGETITTLVDNGDNTFTYTSEDATVTTFDVAHTLQAGATGVVRLVRPDGTFDNVNVTVNTTLPLFNTGAPGDPLDLLLSTDVGNVISLGTDSGLFAGSTGTVSTTLPITGDGSGGSPIDLLLSADVGNQVVLGTDSGVFVPAPTVATTLPIQGDGSAGTPIDLLISTDVGNQVVLGTDSGIFVPTPPAFPNPESILITRNAAESDNNGTGTLFNVRIHSMGPAGTTTAGHLIQVPTNWDTAQNPTVRARLSNTAAADGNIRFQWVIRAFAIGEVLDGVADQTITFTHASVGAADTLYQPTPQLITAGLLAPGDYLALEFTRLGGDALDTQSGNALLHQVSIEFPRLAGNFGVTT